MVSPLFLQAPHQYKQYKWFFVVFSPVLMMLIAATYLIAPSEPMGTYLDIAICCIGLMFFYLLRSMKPDQTINTVTEVSYPTTRHSHE